MKKFYDISGHYAKKHIEKLGRMGIINGDWNGNFRPNDNITRGDAAIMVANAIRCVMMIIAAVIITAVIIIMSVAECYAFSDDWETWYVGAWSGLNCRTAPTTDAEILTTYPHGTELQIIGADGAWWESWDGSIQGWVHSDYLTDKLNNTYNEVDYSHMTCLGEMRITEYTPAPEENGGYSVDRHGNPLAPQVGQIVAVDGVTIPWDRTIYIEGVGYRRTVDSGVHGRVVDVLSWGDLDITGNRKVWLVD